MKPEDQRIAIAEACGWNIEVTPHFKILRKPNDPKEGYCCGIHLSDDEVWEAGLTGDENGDFQFPDYLSDLNAMHEAEKTLPNFGSYVTVLCRVMGYSCDSAAALEDCVRASASERAEAFLKTLGLWKDSPPLNAGETPAP